jgi:geranyl-CoA carboxylase alpha subunit
MSSFRRILIANRGEIACRIIATASRLGYETVAVYSAADSGARHVRLADQAVEIGPAPVGQSYLSMERLLAAARSNAADAVHPGYGFLSENADFAQACLDAGLVFIGPSPAAIRAMGSKRAAKQRVAAAGVPVLPGYHGTDQDDQTLLSAAASIGLPLMIKASAGGGGRGLRLVTDFDTLPDALKRARAEAESGFGNGELILERALIAPRHVEIQVFGDRFGTLIHLGERDCSVQRRHQKVIEEAPCPAVSAELRAALGSAAIAAARTVDYVGAGTIEFLLDADGRFSFMEMNTRLQVEHPVTEAITGLDLVEWQLRVAAGEPLPLRQDQVQFSGHAIEARLYAEDPAHGWLPQTGTVLAWRPPPEARCDHGLTVGEAVTVHYDPMLAKLIVHGVNRDEACRKLRRALDQTVLHGVTTNRSLLRQIAGDPVFTAGQATTTLLSGLTIRRGDPPAEAQAVAAALLAGQPGWRSHGTARTPLRLGWPGGHARLLIEATAAGDGLSVSINGQHQQIADIAEEPGLARLTLNGVSRCIPVTRTADGLFLDWVGETWTFTDLPLSTAQQKTAEASDRLLAPMPGTVIDLRVAEGALVSRGQTLLVLEAMKMQMELKAPLAGTVTEIRVRPGQQVAARSVLIQLNPAEPGAGATVASETGAGETGVGE